MSDPEKIYEMGSSIPILVYGRDARGKTTFGGARPQGVVLDELGEDMGSFAGATLDTMKRQQEAMLNNEILYGEPQQPAQCGERLKRSNGNLEQCGLATGHPGVHRYEPVGVQVLDVPMPPHASYPSLNAKARPGDDIVIIGGEQRGWRGRITDVEATTITARMTKPDGSKANNGMPVAHQAKHVAKVLVTPPAFASPEDADAWLTAMDREIRPEYLPGEIVQFERQVRVKKRGVKPVQKRVLTGRVVGWKVDAHVENSPTGRGPSYRVLTLDLPMNDGYPTILWVEPASIVSG